MKILSNQQRLHFINTEQLYENYIEAFRHARSYAYGMRWKTVNKTEYLFRESDRRGNGKSLGPRSEETEAILAAFHKGKLTAQERLKKIEDKINEQARLNKALRLGRVPRIIANILREIDKAGLADAFTVIGTQSLYAYESIGGAHFLLELLASGDVDLLYDNRKKINLISAKLTGEGLLGLLKKADRTFECIRKRSFRAANAGQFMVDLIIAPRPIHQSTPITFSNDDLVATEVPGLQWLLNVPKVKTIAIDEDGWPTPFHVTDPRAFALHKTWLSLRDDREPIKKTRDLDQAKAVAKLVVDHLPHLPFKEILTSLHADVRKMVRLIT